MKKFEIRKGIITQEGEARYEVCEIVGEFFGNPIYQLVKGGFKSLEEAKKYLKDLEG